VPLNYIVLRPSLAVCEARAAIRAQGRIFEYTGHRDFYALSEDSRSYALSGDEADACIVAKRIYEGLKAGKFAVA
jgi:hypothetical protein